ncbi:MAG: DNA mismatch repair protein MutS [Acidobacteria bacterium]|nr:MAG: DNA mismatch repair protein MutS [Acidobacteriota bacterium]
MTRQRDDDTGPRPELPEDDERAWREALDGVRPLPPAPPTVVPRAPATPRAPLTDEAVRSGPWDVELDGERHRGRAPDVAVELLRRLERGEFPVDARCDLHGMTRDEAAAALRRAVDEARHADRRTLLVIHGRGTHGSERRAVLRAFVRQWLCRAEVLAFATAPARLGGPGATLVRLRRPR